MRQRLASSEYSTRCTADCSSRTAKAIVALAPVRAAGWASILGGVLSMSNVTLSISPVSAVAGAFDGASEAETRTRYVPSGTEVVSQTKIGSHMPRLRTFHAVSPSRRYDTSYCSRSLLSSSAFQTNVCSPF